MVLLSYWYLHVVLSDGGVFAIRCRTSGFPFLVSAATGGLGQPPFVSAAAVVGASREARRRQKPGSRCVCVWLCVCVESMRLSTEWLSGAMLEHIYIHIYTHLSTASSLSCVRYLSIPRYRSNRGRKQNMRAVGGSRLAPWGRGWPDIRHAPRMCTRALVAVIV